MEKSKKVVLFDIDYTVFNTDTFRKNIYALLAKRLGYHDEQAFYTFARKTENLIKSEAGYFDTELFFKKLQIEAKKTVSIGTLRSIFWDEGLFIESLYEEARSVFQALVYQNNIDIAIFSTGEKKFQRRKIKGLADLLKKDHVHIYIDKLQKLKNILKKYKNYKIFLVDDTPAVLYEARLYSNIFTIWIRNEHNFKKYDIIDDFLPNETISNLSEVTDIVIRN